MFIYIYIYNTSLFILEHTHFQTCVRHCCGGNCVLAYTHVYIYIYRERERCTHTPTHTHTYIRMYKYIYIYREREMYVYIYIYVFIYVCICIYIYIYIIYIYIHTHVLPEWRSRLARILVEHIRFEARSGYSLQGGCSGRGGAVDGGSIMQQTSI